MFFFLLYLVSCGPTEESNAAIWQRMQLVGQRSIVQLLRVDPLLMHNAWTDSMAEYSDENCPPMEEHNGMDLWRQSCTTEDGNQFLGWSLNLRIDHIYEDGIDWDVQDWLSGQARIIAGDVELSNYGDILHQDGAGPSGRRVLSGLVFGNFSWTDPTATNTWLSDDLSIEYEYRFAKESTGWSSTVDAWLSNFDDSIHGEAVIWDGIEFDQAQCAREPIGGTLWLREGEGRWATVQFDDMCDGCGFVTTTGTPMCFDFTMWFDWSEYPWEERPSIAVGGE